jgi:hypothetical protein
MIKRILLSLLLAATTVAATAGEAGAGILCGTCP